jgi:hypothetical protein
MVLLPDTLDIDPGLEDYRKKWNSQWRPKVTTKGTRLWSLHFAPLGSSRGIQLPRSWRDFFTYALLHPNRFTWAKAFLESKAWELTASAKDGEMFFSFSIPASCPLQLPIGCSGTQDSMMQNLNYLDDISSENQKLLTPLKQVVLPLDLVSTFALLLKRKQAKDPLVDTEVRRSERLKGNHHGFKSNTCPGRDCFCCSIEAPMLTTKVIKNLGKDLCHISEEKLNEEKLKKQPLAQKTVGPRTKQGKKESQNKDDDKLPKKKKNRKK